jgi:hypothetical protein
MITTTNLSVKPRQAQTSKPPSARAQPNGAYGVAPLRTFWSARAPDQIAESVAADERTAGEFLSVSRR